MSTVPASFIRPADITAYASGDLVANSTTAGSVVPLTIASADAAGGEVAIRRVFVRKSGTSVTTASFRVHFYRAAPTAANGDNAAWSTDLVDDWLGSVDVTVDRAFSDGAAGVGSPSAGAEIAFDRATALYALIEARSAYTPASGEVFTVEAEVQSVR